MTTAELLAVLARAATLGALTVTAGGFAFLALVARPAGRERGGPAFADLERLVPRVARGGLALFGAAAALDLWLRAAAAAGAGPGERLDPGTLATFATATWYGRVWLARLLLAALLAVALAGGAIGDRVAFARLPLAVLLLALQPLAGHAVSASRPALVAWQVTADVCHVLAAGAWAGGLPFLALLLARRRDGRGGEAAAAVVRRFSTLGALALSVLLLAGAANAWALVGSVPGLVGTPYGRLLLAKLGLLVPLLAFAAWNRFYERRRLGAAALSPGLGRLAGTVAAEAGLAGAILALTGWLASTEPARHADPVWPFAFRLTGAYLDLVPGLESRLLVAVSIAFAGLLAWVVAALFPERRGVSLAVGGVGLLLGGLLVRPLWPFLTIDAYPTTYARPAVRYDVVSVARGLELYGEHCVGCHGPSGRGDGPAAGGLPARPADLAATHTRDHTAGDLFWWISHGIPPAMPGFAPRLDDEARWDLVSAVRALADAAAARRLSPLPASPPIIVAPDLEYVDPTGRRGTLQEARGRVLLLVLADPTVAAGRLARLGTAAARLAAAGGEVAVVDRGAAPDAAVAYGLLAGAETGGHVEFLVDRGGYVRARWRPGGTGGWDDLDRLAALVAALAGEPARVEPAGAHVH